jgi:hypothetical protein
MNNLVKKYFSNKFLINVLPVISINLLFLIFWIIGKYYHNIMLTTFLTIFQTIFNLIINTIYLIIINIRHSIYYKNKIFIINILFMILSCIIGIILHYFCWGVTIGDLLNPDWGTVNLFYTMLLIIPIIFFIGIIEQIILILIYNLRWKKGK